MNRTLSEIEVWGAKTSAESSFSSVRSRVRLLQEAHQSEAAVQVWHQFIQQHPQDADAMNELGSVFVGAGRVEEGLNLFRQALTIRPDFPSAKINFGVGLRQLNRLDEAISTFKEVVTTNPENGLACFHLGVALHSLGQYEE